MFEKDAKEYVFGMFPTFNPSRDEYLIDFFKKAAEFGYNKGRNARIKELEETCKDLSDKFDFQVKRVMQLEAQIEKMQEKLKADLIARLEEQMQYSTSPSCTKGMELFIRSIEEWEIKENG